MIFVLVIESIIVLMVFSVEWMFNEMFS